MSNVNEVSTRKHKVVYNPEIAKKDNNRHAKDAADFGKDDYKAIIHRNMGKDK